MIAGSPSTVVGSPQLSRHEQHDESKGLTLVWSIVSARGRSRLSTDAARSRADFDNFRTAVTLVIAYNAIGSLDIISTYLNLVSGSGEEANPVMRAAMDHLGNGWIGAKLFLQLVITAMVLWFPHRIVLIIFLLAVTSNAAIVANNFLIYAGVR